MASGNGTTLMQEIYDQFLICKICFETYKRPKTLSCLHIFCTDCLEKHQEAELERSYRYLLYSRAISCPICRKKTELPSGGVKRLPDNFLVGNLTEVINRRMPSTKIPLCEICQSNVSKQAVSKCLDCAKFLCAACVDLHKKTKVTAAHSLFDTEVEKDIECKVHEGEVVRFYCEYCETCICVLCTFQEHKSHSVVPFTEGMEKHRNSLDALVLSCRERITQLKDHLDLINRFENDVHHTETEIRDTAIASIAAIRKRERQMKQDLYETFGEDTFEYLKEKVALQECLDNLMSTCNLTDIVVKDNSIELLLLKKEIQDKLNLQLQRRIQEPPVNIRKQIKFLPGSLMFGVLDVDGNNSHYDMENVSGKNWSGCDVTMQTDGPKMEEGFTTMGKLQCECDTMWTQTEFEPMKWEKSDKKDLCGTSTPHYTETFSQSTMTYPPNQSNIETMTENIDVVRRKVQTDSVQTNDQQTETDIQIDNKPDSVQTTDQQTETDIQIDNKPDSVQTTDQQTETDIQIDIKTDSVQTTDQQTETGIHMDNKIHSVQTTDQQTETDIQLNNQTDSVQTNDQQTDTEINMEMQVDEMNNIVNHINGYNGWYSKRDQFTNTKQYITCDRQTLTIKKDFKEQDTDTTGLVQFCDQDTLTDASSNSSWSNCHTLTDAINRCNKSTLTNVPLTADKVTSTIRKQQRDQTTCTPYVISLDMGITARVPGEDKAIGTKTIVTMDTSVGEANANAKTADVGVETVNAAMPDLIDSGTMHDTKWSNISTATDLIHHTERASSPHRVFMVDVGMATNRVKCWSSSTNTRTYSVEDQSVNTDPLAPTKAVCKDSQTDLSFAFGMLKKNVIPCHKGTFTEKEHLAPLFDTEEKSIGTLEYSLVEMAVGTQHVDFDESSTSTEGLVDLVDSGFSPVPVSTRHIDVGTDKVHFTDTGCEAYSPKTCEAEVSADIKMATRNKITSTNISTSEASVSAALPLSVESVDFGVNVNIPAPHPEPVPKVMTDQGINVNTFTPETAMEKILIDKGVNVDTYTSNAPSQESLQKIMVDQGISVNTYGTGIPTEEPPQKTLVDQSTTTILNSDTPDALTISPKSMYMVDQGINVNTIIPFEVQSPVCTREIGVTTDSLALVEGNDVPIPKTTMETGVATVSPALVHTAMLTDETSLMESRVTVEEIHPKNQNSMTSKKVLVETGTLAYGPRLTDTATGDGNVHNPMVHLVSTATGDGDVWLGSNTESQEASNNKISMVHSSTMTPVITHVDSGTGMIHPFTKTVETSTLTISTTDKETSAEQPETADNSTMTFIEQRSVGVLKRPQVISRGFMAQPVETREKQTLTKSTALLDQGCNTERLNTADKNIGVQGFSTITKETSTDPVKMVDEFTNMAPVLQATRNTSPFRPFMSDRGSSPIKTIMKDASVSIKADTRECDTSTTPVDVRNRGTETQRTHTYDRHASPIRFPVNHQGTSMPKVSTKNAASATQASKTVNTGTTMPSPKYVSRETTPVRWPVKDQEVLATVNMVSKDVGTPNVQSVECGTTMPHIRLQDSSTDMPQIVTSEKGTRTVQTVFLHKNVSTDSVNTADKQTAMEETVDIAAAYKDLIAPKPLHTITRGTCTPQTSSVNKETSPPPHIMEDRATSPLHTFTKEKSVYVTLALLKEPRETFQKAGNVKKVLKSDEDEDGSAFSPGLAPIKEDSKESTPEEEDRLPNGAMLMRSVATCTNSPVITHVEKFWSSSNMGGGTGSTFSSRGTGPTSSIVCRVEMGTNTVDYSMENKQTCTPPIAMMDKAISTESVSVDTKMAECISKLRTVRQRLEQQTTQGPTPLGFDSNPIYSRASMTGTQTMAITSVTPTLSGFITSTKPLATGRPIGRSKSVGEKLNEKEQNIVPFMTPELPRRKSVPEKPAEENIEKEDEKKKPSLARKLRLDITQLLRSSSASERAGGHPSFPKPSVKAVKAQVIPKLEVSTGTMSSSVGVETSSIGVGTPSRSKLREHRHRHRRLGTSRDVKSPTPPSVDNLPKRKLLADGPDLAKARLAKQKSRLEKQQAIENPNFKPTPLIEEEEEEEEARDAAPAPLGLVSRLVSSSPARPRPVTLSPTRRPVPFRPLGADEQARRRGQQS